MEKNYTYIIITRTSEISTYEAKEHRYRTYCLQVMPMTTKLRRQYRAELMYKQSLFMTNINTQPEVRFSTRSSVLKVVVNLRLELGPLPFHPASRTPIISLFVFSKYEPTISRLDRAMIFLNIGRPA